MTTQCQHCGSQLEQGAVICVQCGQAIDTPAPSAPLASASEHSSVSASSELQTGAPLFSAVTESANRGLTGIGGWLILPAIGLAASPFMSLHGIYADLNILYSGRYLPALSASPGLELLIVFELATNLLFLGSLIVLNILLYQRKKKFPPFIITFYAGQCVLVFIDLFAALQFNPHTSPSAAIRAFVACLVWIPYFLQSERVKLTFVS
jgi:hypothetical protein